MAQHFCCDMDRPVIILGQGMNRIGNRQGPVLQYSKRKIIPYEFFCSNKLLTIIFEKILKYLLTLTQ